LHGTPHELFTLAAEMFANAVERRRLQRTTDDHRQALAHALRLGTMSELATGLAHELNQPLAAMASYAGACMRRIEAGTIDGPELTDLLGRVSNEALRAGEIIRRLRAHVGKGRPRRSSHRVDEIVASVLSLLDGMAADHDVQIFAEIEDGLPRVLVDATEIEQVLINLVQNGIDSIVEHDGPRREISIHANCIDRGAVTITVADTGGGIVPEALDTLFDQFSSTKAKGLGLGLAICRLIVVSHGGTITGGLGGDGGAVFKITLPVAMDMGSI
jgi:C4-dicarboxylate-specific signal transduction histidine kinase